MLQRLRTAAVAAATLLTVAACGGSDKGGATAEQRATGATATRMSQPLDGVPAGTRPLPMPEPGKAYNNPQPRDNVQDGGTLTLPIGEFGPNFNHFSIDGNLAEVSEILNWLIPHLWKFSPAGEAFPNPDYLLSAELISENPETVKFTLNPKAKWNDGTPIDWTAFDTVWKTQRGVDKRYNPAGTTGFESIAGVAKGKKDNEVIVTFGTPFYPFESLFDEVEHPKNLDPAFYKTGWMKNLHPELMAGPFTVESLTEETLTLKRNPSWWGDPPKLDRVVYRRMELVASINAFQNGEIDGTNVAIADRLEQISGMQHVQVRRGYDTRTGVYIIGRDSALFKDEAARKAFMLGTNRKLLAEIQFQGLDWSEEAPGSAVMFPWQKGYRDNMTDLHYDPEAAKRVLDAAGWVVGDDGYRHKDGKTAEFTYVDFGDDPIIVAMARAQQKMAKDIGLLMQIDVRKAADFAATMTNRNFDVVTLAWSATDPFGYSNVCQLYCSDSESNMTGIGNKELDEELRKPLTIANTTAAIEAANDAEQKAIHLFGMLPLFNGPRQVAVKEGLANSGPAGFTKRDPVNVGWQKRPASAGGEPSAGAR
jgi:peptide/nickel transport system substrate-binding protein